jgi:hypothetical protein
LAAEGRHLRVAGLGVDSGVVTAWFPRASIVGPDLRIEAGLSRSPLLETALLGSSTFAGHWPEEAWAVELTEGADGGRARQFVLAWSRDRWIKVDESDAHEQPAQVAAWSPGTALVFEPAAKGCGTLRVVGADAKGTPPKLDARVCPERIHAMGYGDVLVAGHGFIQRFKRGEPSGGPPMVLPWNDERGQCPGPGVTTGAMGSADQQIIVAGRCGDSGQPALLHHDGTFWHRYDGPDDDDFPVAVHRTRGGDLWLLTQKNGHEAEFASKPAPAAGSLWFKPKDGLWNRVHMSGTIPEDVGAAGGAKVDCVPNSFWARRDDDVWASYECRAGASEKAATWSLVFRTGAQNKPVRLTR